MLIAILVFVFLVFIDFILLLIMPKFYFKIGIPIYKRSAVLSKKVSLRDLGNYFGFTEKYVYKVKGDTILFRTNISNSGFRKTSILSIVKGEAKINNDEINIIQRINLSTLYLIIVALYILFAVDFGIRYKVAMGFFILFLIFVIFVFAVVRNEEIEKVRIDIEDNLIRDHSEYYIKKHR